MVSESPDTTCEVRDGKDSVGATSSFPCHGPHSLYQVTQKPSSLSFVILLHAWPGYSRDTAR
jgi:hypothetical protein